MRGHLLSYVLITTPFAVVMGVGMMLSNLLRAAGQGRQSMWVLLAGTATVALLDPVVIFVLDGGMEGIAWAGGAGRAATLALGAWLVFRRHRLVEWPGAAALREHLAAIGRIALPAALTTLATPAAVIFTVSTYAGFGPSVMAGATVVDRVLQLAYSLFFVLPGAIGPILGQNLGAGQWDRVKHTVGLTSRWSLLYGFSAAALLALLAPWIADAFQVAGPGRDLIVFFCRYGSFAWALQQPVLRGDRGIQQPGLRRVLHGHRVAARHGGHLALRLAGGALRRPRGRDGRPDGGLRPVQPDRHGHVPARAPGAARRFRGRGPPGRSSRGRAVRSRRAGSRCDPGLTSIFRIAMRQRSIRFRIDTFPAC